MGQRTNHRATLFALTLQAAALVSGCARPAPVASPATPPPPRLLVTIVVDQLAAWLAAERWPRLPADGGFARLRREGLYVEDLRFEHAATDTAPGHAALFTGNVPARTGIFANETLAAGGGPARSILADPTTQVVGVDAGVVGGKEGSSLARLSGDTVADRFVAEMPGAQVFSFSLKDRASLFGSGRTPTVTLWLDTDLGEFVTSTKFPAPPSWVMPLAGKAAVTAAARAGWQLSAAEQAWVQAHAETADVQAGEGGPGGLSDHFPHSIPSAKALRSTPQGDVLLLGLARAAVDVARTNRRPTLLALSLSSNDYVGHAFGPHSWEAWDELYRLDRALAEFLSYLDGAFGRDGYAVMLSADHGSVALPELAGTPADPWCKAAQAAGDTPERWQRACGPRARVDTHAATAAVEQALVAALGAGPWTIGMADPYLYLTEQARALAPDRRALLIATVVQVLQPLGIDRVVDARTASAPCARGESLSELLCGAISPRGEADLYLVVRPGTFLGVAALEGHGITHGSPYLYDRSVPLLVRAPGRVAPGQVRRTPTSFAAFARTAATLLGVHAPATDRPGQDLTGN